MNTDVQYLTNDKGKRTAVVVPIEDWEALENLRKELFKQKLLNTLTDGFRYIQDVHAGKQTAQTLTEFLNEVHD